MNDPRGKPDAVRADDAAPLRIRYGGAAPPGRASRGLRGTGTVRARPEQIRLTWQRQEGHTAGVLGLLTGWVGMLLLALTARKVTKQTVVDPRQGKAAYDPGRGRISLELPAGGWVTFRLRRVSLPEHVAFVETLERLYGDGFERMHLPRYTPLEKAMIVLALIAIATIALTFALASRQ